ncbi:MAG: hypothetical protein PVF43_14885 [Candidatus Eiseniibacteriota bacterium]|jgi:hypothetical protein
MSWRLDDRHGGAVQALAILLAASAAFGGMAGPAAAREGDGAGGNRPRLPVRFDSEIVRLVIEPDTVEVTGHYWLVCDPDFRHDVRLFYPYPEDSLLGGAHTLSLAWRTPGEPWREARFQEADGMPAVPGTTSRRGARWQLPPAPGDTLEVRTVYRQALRSTYARYIVTTTRAWQRPLTRARFEIELPPGATPVRFSFPFRWHDAGDGGYYLFETTRFMPDEDIVVEWEP